MFGFLNENLNYCWQYNAKITQRPLSPLLTSLCPLSFIAATNDPPPRSLWLNLLYVEFNWKPSRFFKDHFSLWQFNPLQPQESSAYCWTPGGCSDWATLSIRTLFKLHMKLISPEHIFFLFVFSFFLSVSSFYTLTTISLTTATTNFSVLCLQFTVLLQFFTHHCENIQLNHTWRRHAPHFIVIDTFHSGMLRPRWTPTSSGHSGRWTLMAGSFFFSSVLMMLQKKEAAPSYRAVERQSLNILDRKWFWSTEEMTQTAVVL